MEKLCHLILFIALIGLVAGVLTNQALLKREGTLREEITALTDRVVTLEERLRAVEENQKYALDYARGLFYKKTFEGAVKKGRSGGRK